MDSVKSVDASVKSAQIVQDALTAGQALQRATPDEKELVRALLADPRADILLWGDTGMAILLVEGEQGRCVLLQGVEETDVPMLLQLWSESRGATVTLGQDFSMAPVAVEDLMLCFPLGLAYYREIPVPGSFIPASFRQSWAHFYSTGLGQIIGLWRGGQLVGVFGGLVFPHPNDGRLIAQQLFWYVRPEQRGTPWSFKLMDAFEAWAADQGAVTFRTGYLLSDPYAQKLETAMERQGFTPFEATYDRPIRRPDA